MLYQDPEYKTKRQDSHMSHVTTVTPVEMQVKSVRMLAAKYAMRGSN